ncbi:MAG: pilus assembly protein PilZ [Spirochaetaceae bacterium]|nr:MAG: pilus assembly protein PilZ [Spirochaetaceae bacterium]
MGFITSQQLSRYYISYKEREITFTRQIVEVLKLLPRDVYIKNRGDQLPCIIYSTSMTGAKIVASLKTNSLQKIRQANNLVSLRFAFGRSDKKEPLYFFVPAKITNYTFYSTDKPDLYFLSLEYTAKPPDDLIEMLGQLFDTHANFKRRKDERIELNPANIKLLGIESKEAALVIDNQAKKCIIRDLSFSGTKVLLFGARPEDVRKTAVLQFGLVTQVRKILIPGTIVRFEEVVGRDDIGAFGIQFVEENTPMSYKMLINNTLRSNRPASH